MPTSSGVVMLSKGVSNMFVAFAMFIGEASTGALSKNTQWATKISGAAGILCNKIKKKNISFHFSN